MHPNDPSSHAYATAPVENNGLAIAAFVVALVGVVTGGLLSPLGLILGLVALGKRGGRGFAITAIILGLIGSCGLIIGIAILVVLGIGAAVAGIAFIVGAAGSAENVGVAVDMANLAGGIVEYRERTGSFPASLDLLPVDPDALVDPWGGQLVYEPTGEQLGFDLVSSGPDGMPGTDDDIRLTELGALFGFPDARIEVDGGAGSGGITRIVAGELEITVDPGDARGGGDRFVVRHGDRVIFEAGGGHFRAGSPAEPGPPPAAPEAPVAPDAPTPPGTSEDVPLGGG